MTRLRFKIIKQKDKYRSPQPITFFRKSARQIRNQIKLILSSDTLPLVITPPIFVAFASLEWWHWYHDMQTPSPVLLTITALALSIYCCYKFITHKKQTKNQEGSFEIINE